MFKKSSISAFIKFLTQRWRSFRERMKKHIDYGQVLLLLVVILYNFLLYNLRVLEISWDGAFHATNGIILHDMVREIILRDRYFSPFAMYEYVITYSTEWYPSLDKKIVYYPIFVPVLFMLSFFAFGISFSSAYLVVILMGNLCVIVTYFLGTKLFDRRIGLLAALFLSISSVFFAFSKTALLDVPVATMFTLSMYSLIRTKKGIGKKQRLKKQSFLTGLLIGLAFMTKPQCVLVFPIIILYFIINYAHKLKIRHFQGNLQKLVKILKSNPWIFYGIIPAFFLIGFQIGILVISDTLKFWMFERVEIRAVQYSLRSQKPSPLILRTLWELPFYVIGIGLSIPELGGVLVGLAYAIYRRTKKDKLLLSWYFITYITFSALLKQARFFLIAFPVIFILMSRAIVEVYERLKKYHPSAFKMGTIAVVAIIFLFGVTETLQYPYGYYYHSTLPKSETPMEEVALFLIEKNGTAMQMTMNPTISASAMSFYVIKHDREHNIRYYDMRSVTRTRGSLTIEEFRQLLTKLNVSHLLISDPGNVISYRYLNKYVDFILENPDKFSLVKTFTSDSIYVYIYEVKTRLALN